MAETITRDRVDEMFRVVFQGLAQMGGKARPKDLFEKIEPKLNLTEHERGTLKTGGVRWETLIRWYSVDCTKAGYLEKSGGYWILTPKGTTALKLPLGELIRSAQKLYREWKSQRDAPEPPTGTDVVEVADTERVARQAAYEKAVETAREGIEALINSLGAYDFQNLVGELLRAMGYHVRHIASPGADGGVDLVAYRDPLGTTSPWIKVQVKHREQKASVKEVRELEGLLRKEGDIGLLVSSGGFTSEAEREVRGSHRHIESMDLDRLIALWIEHYNQLRESGRQLLPLATVHFLAPQEE